MTDITPHAERADDAPRPHGPRRRAALLVNVGTPDSPTTADVRRYLAEFLSDPRVIQLPWFMRWMQKPLGALIARTRGPQSAEKYRRIWTERGSPLRTIMEDQRAALAKTLPDAWRIYLAMRYGAPSIADALRQATNDGVEDLVVVPMYPQFSQTTTGTLVEELYRALRSMTAHFSVATRTAWYDDVGYLNAQARLLHEFASQNGLTPDNAVLLYSAHGLPASYVERGDPYKTHIEKTVALVNERLGWPTPRTRLAFQSRLGPTAWLRPNTRDTLLELAQTGERRVLVCPISFSVDCLETLEEIDIGYREAFEERGGELFRCPALNTYSHFINALKLLVERGPRPIADWGPKHQPLIRPQHASKQRDAAPEFDRLVMIGASIANRIEPPAVSRLRYASPNELRGAKRPHHEVAALLREWKDAGLVSEAMVWNTCQRFELYTWIDASADGEAECVIAELRRRLADDSTKAPFNVLLGGAAWRHLARTLAGLNSGLPGDKDVVEQFESARQAAEDVGVAGPRLRALAQAATTATAELRAATGWGRIDPGYVYAALSRIAPKLPLRMTNCRHVVIGGSSTSRSVLETLFERFRVHESDVTLIHRTHQGGGARQLRRAVGHGRRLRVDAYRTRAVLDALADADVVHMGVDCTEPLLDGAELVGLRDFAKRPLVIIDFNTAGSTTDLADAPGIVLWDAERIETEVVAYADELCSKEEFSKCVAEAEQWIEKHTPKTAEFGASLPCGCDAAQAPPCDTCRHFTPSPSAGSSLHESGVE